MKKVLFVASVDYHFTAFHLPYLRYFKEQGFEVHIASRKSGEAFEDVDVNHNVCFERFPISKSNIKAYKLLKGILSEHHFDIIHCHTPVAAMLTRLAARKERKSGAKVLYTAHGFHFYKGAPILNWLLYFPIEWICSFFTDALITINKEDYARAKKRLNAKQTFYVPGVGIDTGRYNKHLVDRSSKRVEIGIKDGDFLLLSVGELSKRKNHKVIIKAIAELGRSDIQYIICGRGELEQYLMDVAASLNVANNVKFLGFRSDIREICAIADLFVFPSLQEGLPVALMEAMASGLPCVASNIRGNTDLVEDGRGGILCSPSDSTDFANAIQILKNDEALRLKMARINIEKIADFDIANVAFIQANIYRSMFDT